MKRKIFLIAFILIAVFGVVGFFMPKPLGEDIEEVIQMKVNFNYGDEESVLENVHFIPRNIIKCIEKYKEQRTVGIYKGYRMKDVEVHIDFRTKKGTKSIVIGNEIYSVGSDNIKCRILDGENFRKELYKACGVPLNEETNRIMTEVSNEASENVPYSLTALLECNSENAESVALSLKSGKTVSVDKDKFFGISDKTELIVNENPKEATDDGIYIHIQNKDGNYTYAYITQKGEVDKYTAFESGEPVSSYILAENAYYELEKLANGVKKPEKNYAGEIIFLICMVAVAFIGLFIYNKKS